MKRKHEWTGEEKEMEKKRREEVGKTREEKGKRAKQPLISRLWNDQERPWYSFSFVPMIKALLSGSSMVSDQIFAWILFSKLMTVVW